MKRLVCMVIATLAPVAAGSLLLRFPAGGLKSTGSLSGLSELLTALSASWRDGSMLVVEQGNVRVERALRGDAASPCRAPFPSDNRLRMKE
ncbi:MAG: hypothetical protein ACLGSA_08710 [Acidobacteriota bacterium]